VNYEVPKEVLEPYLPQHTELDSWQNKYFLSLVGFMFKNTKLLGIPIPFHRNFEEVNLRFYVKHYDGKEWKRGVVFVKEIVPKHALSFVANSLYKEHYQTLPMRHEWASENDKQNIAYMWRLANQWQSMRISATIKPENLQPASHEEFIAEHYWGYTKVTPHTTYEYEVVHPKWQVYPTEEVNIQVNFASVYGKDFGFLNNATPYSSLLAEGSEIYVKAKTKIASK